MGRGENLSDDRTPRRFENPPQHRVEAPSVAGTQKPADADRWRHYVDHAVSDDLLAVAGTARSQRYRSTARLQAPSLSHWFGTDEVGRDLFSRVLIGSQQSIAAGLAVVLIAGISGSLLGCLSGVLGGRSDALIMRLMDIMLSIPSLVLTMALAAALGPKLIQRHAGDRHCAHSVLCPSGARTNAWWCASTASSEAW